MISDERLKVMVSADDYTSDEVKKIVIELLAVRKLERAVDALFAGPFAEAEAIGLFDEYKRAREQLTRTRT